MIRQTEGMIHMTSSASDSHPSHTVTPRLLVGDGAAAIVFYKHAFHAEERGERHTDPDGHLIHAEILIGNAIVTLSDDDGDAAEHQGGRVTAIMETQWPDVDIAWQRAVTAGAEIIFPLADQFYGQRSGRLRDPFGQEWILSQPISRSEPDN
jgi:PhnB protein